MNVLFPGEGTREAFWVIIGLMIAAIVAMVSFFRWRRWL
jgi:Mg2+ and Co2+ transporter CorA